MQALPIANVATISQAAPCVAGASTAAASDNPASAGELPPFAQVVREILVRTTTQDATQPAHTSRSNVLAASASVDSQLPTVPHGTSSLSLPQLIDPATLNLAVILNQPIPIQPPLPTPPAVSPIQTPAVSKPWIAKTCSVLETESDPQSAGQCSTKVAPTETTPPLPATAQETLPFSLSTLDIQILDRESSSVPNPPVTSSFPRDANIVVAAHENGQPVNPTAAAKKTVDLEVYSNTPSTFAGIAISTLGQQLAPLQPTAPANVYITIPQPSTVPHSSIPQNNAKTALDSAPPVTTLPAQETTPLSSSKNAPLVHAETQPATPPANSSSMNQSASQNNSSNSLDAKESASPSATSSTMPHDASSFAQALANAGNTNSKADAAPASTNQQPAMSPVSVSPNERVTQPATPPPPAAPQVNTPQTVFRSLDTTATPTVNDAQVSQSSGHSEMRIAMQTDKFGAVELHTRVAGDEIGAAITVEKRDAHAALAVELPALQQALSEKQLRVDQITLLHGPLHSTTGDASGHQQSQGQQADRRTPRELSLPPFAPDSGSAFLFSQTAAEPSVIFDSRGRLSVQA